MSLKFGNLRIIAIISLMCTLAGGCDEDSCSGSDAIIECDALCDEITSCARMADLVTAEDRNCVFYKCHHSCTTDWASQDCGDTCADMLECDYTIGLW